MPKIAFEPLVVPVEPPKTELITDTLNQRPSWLWILREEIELLCAQYGLILEYGDEVEAESCAIFYDDGP